MGFRFQRRLNLSRGMGLNVSKSGVSASVRTRYGTFGTKGFSIRTGIRGLTFRQGYRRSSGGGVIGLAFMVVFALLPLLINLTFVAVQIICLLAVWAVRIGVIAPVNLLIWTFHTCRDYVAYRRALRGSAQLQESTRPPIDHSENEPPE